MGYSISIYYQNVRGLRTKVDEFFAAVSVSQYDVVVLTETWLNEEFCSSQLFGQEYSVFRKDRDTSKSGKKRGGGVLIAVANRLCTSRSAVRVDDEIEQLWVTVVRPNRNICIGVVYLPPELASEIDVLERHLADVTDVSNSLKNHDLHLLFGDYNQPNIVWKRTEPGPAYPDALQSSFSNSSSVLLDGMTLLDMAQISTVTNMRNRTLDLVFVNEDALTTCSVHEAEEPLINIDTHHPPLLVSLQCLSSVRFESLDESGAYNFRKADFVALNLALMNVDWSPLDSMADVNEAVDMFTNTLTQLFCNHVPVHRPRQKPVWSNRHLRALKRRRASTLNYYSSHRNPISKHEFSVASKAYRRYNHFLYLQYVRNTQQNLKSNPKRFWSFVNEKRNESGLPSSMFLGDETCSSPEEICNLFASHFGSVFSTASISTHQILDGLQNVPRNVVDIRTTNFTPEDILNAIGKLKSSYAVGPDGIPPVVFKYCANTLCVPLQLICNKSVSQSVFPHRWKISAMFPAFKKGDKRNVANYRGVTSLSTGSKLLEILVGNILFQGFKNYISTDQHGFYPGRSTATNLVEFTSYCLRNMEDGAQIDTLYTDLKAAFDRVDHTLLLCKLKELGVAVNLVAWIESYLRNRCLFVTLGRTASRRFSNHSGVPQGSNLGPLLFSVFFNDVCYLIPAGCRLLYADDLKIFLLVRSWMDCKELQRILDLFTDWCSRNLLIISVTKCSVISFTRKKSPLIWNYSIAAEPVERVTVVKDLGVTLDFKMTFRDHYCNMISKANRNLGFIFRITREFRDPYCLRALYYTLVRSNLESAAVVWGPYTDIWSSRIEAIQSRFVKYALRFLPWTNPNELPPYEDRCRLLSMDTLAKRRSISRAMFVAKLLKGEIDSPNILARINISVAPRLLRSRDFLRLDFQRTDYGQNEPIRAMCNVFNTHYNDFDFTMSTSVFKNRLKRTNL